MEVMQKDKKKANTGNDDNQPSGEREFGRVLCHSFRRTLGVEMEGGAE